MSRVLVFGDIHLPFMESGYLEFIKKMYVKYKCNKVVCTGDIFDFHRVSFHDSEPNAQGAVQEYEMALKEVRKFYKAFPKAELVLGNHDLRVYRVGKKAQLPTNFFKRFEDIAQTPKGWTVHYESVVIDGVVYIHGEGFSGMTGHLTAAKTNMRSTVMGHLHSHAGINYVANKDMLVWGMNVGCGIDVESYAMEYGKKMKNKPIISCGVVLDGTPHLEYMPLGSRIIRE